MVRPLVTWLRLAIAVIPLAIAPAQRASAQSTEPRSITNVRGDLYLLRVADRATVFLVTTAGIILGDPLDEPTAGWLKNEFTRRFPERDVRYILFSHHHFDRAEGAASFDKTAELVGHRSFNSELKASREKDPDHYAHVVDVESDYSGRRQIRLGGKTVEIVHPGPAHSKDASVIFFPEERIVFAVENPPVGHEPFSFTPFTVADVVEWVHTIRGLDFDTLLTGHGESIPKTQVVALAQYLDDLVSGVAAGYERGLSLSGVQASSILDAHKMESQYTEKNAHIEYVYRTVRFIHVELYGAPALNVSTGNTVYCAGFSSCESGARLPAGFAGMSFTTRRLGGAVEMRLGAQSFSARTSRLYDDTFARRDSLASFLFRYSGPPKKRLSYNLLAGLSVKAWDVQGLSRVKENFAPVGGRHTLAVSGWNEGLTAGTDIAWSVGQRIAIVMPLRFTWIRPNQNDLSPGPVDFHGGIGLRITAYRRIG